MGDINQLSYLRQVLPKAEGPILEVGSKDYGSTSSFRDFYQGTEYVGLDMSEGKGVDVVVDLTKAIAPLRENQFGLAICCSVLEHVEKPWVFARHLTSVVRPGGLLFMSVPWVWRYHAYPDDYFRFSHRGVMSLFDEFTWKGVCFSTNVPGEFVDIDVNDKGELADNRMALMAKTPEGAMRKHLPYLMVNMLGTRGSAPA
jgi:SAM-dependent methyltransferase